MMQIIRAAEPSKMLVNCYRSRVCALSSSLETLIERSQADAAQTQALMQALYGELRALAASYLAAQRPDHTLQPTALVHEAYLRLLGAKPASWSGRLHFFSVAAMAMRQILVNHAAARRTQKRGDGFDRVSLSEAVPDASVANVDLLALNLALDTLDRLEPRQARIVEMRYFAGLDVADIARVLGVSNSTVEKDWRMARLWLLQQLEA